MKHMVVEYDEKSGDLIYNRKLQNGSGTRLYGLEVCKSLSMPKEFLNLANSLRCADNPSNTVMLSRKVSTYNAIRWGIYMCTYNQGHYAIVKFSK